LQTPNKLRLRGSTLEQTENKREEERVNYQVLILRIVSSDDVSLVVIGVCDGVSLRLLFVVLFLFCLSLYFLAGCALVVICLVSLKIMQAW
jgi:hypothetical protein